MMSEVRHVRSVDGTRIAYWSSGDGPPLLLIHGAMSDHARWSEVQEPLEAEFTVYVIDRRGRGESGDHADYSMQREAQDVVAMVEAIDRPATVLGHSYGADCALEAALLTDQIERLILYEPGVLEGVTGYYTSEPMAAALARIETLLDQGDREAAMLLFLRDIIEYPEPHIELMRSSPIWASRVASAHTVPRELRAEADWVFDPERFGRIAVPTLLLIGSESLQIARDGTAALRAAMPNGRTGILKGQGHGAMNTAPDLFVHEVLRFLIKDR